MQVLLQVEILSHYLRMIKERTTDISSFFVAGINYKKTDACTRGQFSINNEQYQQILLLAPQYDISQLFALSTCNRTEIFGFAEDAAQLSKLLCTQTQGTLQHFTESCYTKAGIKAVEHLFNVAAGLDSQILGDYEIVGQIKQAIKISKQNSFLGPYLERLVNEVLQASKKIRTTTALSGGTVSVSFAAVQYVKQFYKEIAGKKILLLGTGKIGSNTCKNIVDYLPGTTVTLINRTTDKASRLALQYTLSYNSLQNMQQCINEADVIMVATNSENPIITKAHFKKDAEKIIIDLSVPCNVAAEVKELKGITLINVDELGKIKDETLKKRTAEIPKVKNIIAEHVKAFMEWHQMRKNVPVLKAVKTHLKKMQYANIEDAAVSALVAGLCDKAAEEKIQKVIDGMAVKMRKKNQHGCQYIEAMNDFITTASN